jgi:hypothetical protein
MLHYLTALQEIIGVSKRNPSFTIFRHQGTPKKIHVYYGAQLLEIVDEDREHPGFKFFIGKMYNSGIPPKALIEHFEIPYSTMRRWGLILQKGDADEIICMLAGSGGPRKLTPEVLRFVENRFQDIYPSHRTNYSQMIRQEIAEVFDFTLSGEALRPYFKRWKQRQKEKENKRILSKNTDSETPGNHTDVGERNVEQPMIQTVQESNRKSMVEFEVNDNQGKPEFLHHVGVLIFSQFLNQVEARLEEFGSFVKQWLSAIMLGAVNIEQSKTLNLRAIAKLMGLVVVSRYQQRRQLRKFALSGEVNKLFQYNAEIIQLDQCSTFYYDPHTKHYAGRQKIIKGWCAAIRFADKVLNMDFIHTSKGQPVYFEHGDVFHDLRERFLGVVGRFRELYHLGNKPLTFVLDRGIYGLETFKKIIEMEQTFFVTWEKGYKAENEGSASFPHHFCFFKTRNHAKDLKMYRFSYREVTWPRNQNVRRIIVRATNPRNNTIEVSILSNNNEITAKKLIELMFSRWLQENDFKYLDKHFGINEITSYQSISYKDLVDVVEDKNIKSGDMKAFGVQRRHTNTQLKTVLLREHQTLQRLNDHEQELVRVNQDIQKLDKSDENAPAKELKKTKTTLKQQCTRANTQLEKYRLKKKELTLNLKALNEQIQGSEKEMSRLHDLIDKEFCKLDTLNKTAFDAIKILARNIFYELLLPFKEEYNNFRDDHVYFRNLTLSHGFIRQCVTHVDVYLFPTAHLPPKLAKALTNSLTQIQKTHPLIPDNSQRELRFFLANSVPEERNLL